MRTETNILTDGEKKMLAALPWAAIVLDDQGNITAANEQWKNANQPSNWLFATQHSNNYFDHCAKKVEHGNDYALRLIFSIREVLDGTHQKNELTVICNEPSSKKWCKVSISSLQKRRPAALLIFTNVTSNMNALSALRESEEKYSKQFEYSVSGIIISNADGDILDANPAACAFLGYSRQELMKGGRSLFVNSGSLNPVEIARQHGKDVSREREEEYMRKDGTLIPVEVISVLYVDGNGERRSIYTFRDKSNERKAKHTLADERRFSQIALNNIPGIFIVINKNLGIIRWNNMLSRELGYKPEELSGINIIDLFEKNDKDWVRNVLNNIFKTGAGNFVANIHSKKAGIKPYHLYFNKFQKKDQEFLVATAVDKTAHIKAEIAREQNFELMSQLFENSPLAMVMIEPDGCVKKANHGFTDLFGYKEKEIIGRNVNPLIATEQKLHEAEEVNIQAFKGISHQQKTVRLNKQNEQIPVIVNTVPIVHEERVIAVYGIYVDMREQIRLENSLQRTIKEKDTLLQELHHRVKNNLAVIASLLDLQIFQEENKDVIEKLSEVHSRIYSIAKIHDTLYQADNMGMIDFSHYLNSINSAVPEFSKVDNNISSKIGSEEVFHLNVNQAVPLSLAIHELIRFSRKKNPDDNKKIQISMHQTGNKIEITIAGLNIFSEGILKDKNNAYQNLLLNTFLEQISAKISADENRDEMVIHFQKNDAAKGTNNALL